MSLLLDLSGTSQSKRQSQTEPEGNPKSLLEDSGSFLPAADSHWTHHVHTLPHPTSSCFSSAHVLSRQASRPGDKSQKQCSQEHADASKINHCFFRLWGRVGGKCPALAAAESQGGQRSLRSLQSLVALRLASGQATRGTCRAQSLCCLLWAPGRRSTFLFPPNSRPDQHASLRAVL